MELSISDLSRLKTAHDLSVQEYGQDWEGLLTLRLGVQNEILLRKHLVTYFKRQLASSKHRLPLHRSVYIHTKNNDIHAHCYVSHKYRPNKMIDNDSIRSMKECWLNNGEMRNMSRAKKEAYGELYVQYKPFTKRGSEYGNFGSYGIKDGNGSDYVYEASDLKYKDATAHALGLQYMKRYGHTTYYQNIVAAG